MVAVAALPNISPSSPRSVGPLCVVDDARDASSCTSISPVKG